jgi:SAM-dependent methyltransferase
MNRERELAGRNGYERELRFHPVEFLRKRLARRENVRWLDLCCGTGRALFQAADALANAGLHERAEILGVDLVAMFWPRVAPACLRLVTASVHLWEAPGRFDLVTCVHGLHYLGDKLNVIARAVGWLAEDGVFVANLDLANLRREDGRPLARAAAGMFRSCGIDYDRRSRLVSCRGPRDTAFPAVFVGSDDAAGPNYTGQPAVHSRYRIRD